LDRFLRIQEVYLLYMGGIPRLSLIDWKNKLRNLTRKKTRAGKLPLLLWRRSFLSGFWRLEQGNSVFQPQNFKREILKSNKNFGR